MIGVIKLESLESKFYKEITGRKAARVFLKTDNYDFIGSLLRKFDPSYNQVIIQPKEPFYYFNEEFDKLKINLKSSSQNLLYIDEILKITLLNYNALLKVLKMNAGKENLVVIASSNKLEFNFRQRHFRSEFQKELSLFNMVYEID